VTLRVCVLGAGSWGTTVASLAARNEPTMLWARNPETAREINDARTNARNLRDARLPRALRASASIEEAVHGADAIARSLSKGLERGTQLRVTEVIHEVPPKHRAGAG